MPDKSIGVVVTQSIRVVEADNPLTLECGRSLAPIEVAFETYGKLNSDRTNTILICHALSGDAHVAGKHQPDDLITGWWDIMVGPGKPIDTNRFYVVCSNVIGGCKGTTGPASIDPLTNEPYGISFPMITVSDMVKVQKLLLEKLGVKEIYAVIGGSMGGMQVLRWMVDHPAIMRKAMIIGASGRLSAQGIAFNAVGRYAILSDPHWREGNYTHYQTSPDKGLSIARMIGHITYLSEDSMHSKFGRHLQEKDDYGYDFSAEFQVESYLQYQGSRFVERFDANSYMYITKAIDYFDITRGFGTLDKTFENVQARSLFITFSSDWLFPTSHSVELVEALQRLGKEVSLCELNVPYGHDAFLLNNTELNSLVRNFLTAE